jgi:ribosome recycling factor
MPTKNTLNNQSQMVGRVKELTEETKVALRNVRRDGNKMADQAEKDKDLSEDDRDKAKEDIQNLTKQYENQAADLAKAREKDVMED